MLARRTVLALAACAVLTPVGPAAAQQKLNVVATFSILADVARNVGGDRVEVTSLVGPNGDSHVFSPTPADARTLAAAAVVVTNGLGFEGWMERLVKASGTKAAVVVASKGIKTRQKAGGGDDHGHGDKHGHDHGTKADPHVWQSIANVKVYAANIRDALAKADPAGKSAYETNTAAYLAKLTELETEVKATLARIPPERRKVIVTHNAFGYFQDAYGVEFLAVQGVSTESQPSAADVARIIAAVKENKVSAIFIENITDPRQLERIAKETGARIGGTIYSDAVTETGGVAPSYVEMMRHNVQQLVAALAGV
jgi:zinc/manganese transport system substrate-binding protein